MSSGARVVRLATVALTLVALSLGCNVGRAMIASSGDYADYRRYRVAETLEQRLAAAWYYLNHHQEGVYAEPVRAYFRKAEPVFYAVRRQSLSGLEAYLRSLPDGPHADEALAELMRLRRLQRREEAAEARAAAAGQRLDAERERRGRLAALPLRWLRLLLAEQLWTGALSEAPAEFLVAYRVGLPEPLCGRDEGLEVFRCTKVLESSFPAFDEEELVERPMTLWVELELDDRWQLRAARLSGPELFARLQEARDRRALPAGDARARQAAVEAFGRRAMELLAEAAWPCTPGEATVGLSARCGPLSVVVRAGEGEEHDEIHVTLVGPRPSSGAAVAPADEAPAAAPGQGESEDSEDDEPEAWD